MYYTIYKITNNINGKIYIGSHKTKNIDDKYMGSGKYLKRAIEKDGIENFSKEILFIFDNPDEMYAKEAELVNENFLSNENTYNLKVGGFGGWDYVNSNEGKRKIKNQKARQKANESMNKRYGDDWRSFLGKKAGAAQFAKNGVNKKFSESGKISMLGKKHSQETKDLIGLKNSIAQKGEKNSQFGTIWITNGIKPIKIKKDDVIPEGYIRGKKFIKALDEKSFEEFNKKVYND